MFSKFNLQKKNFRNSIIKLEYNTLLKNQIKFLNDSNKFIMNQNKFINNDSKIYKKNIENEIEWNNSFNHYWTSEQSNKISITHFKPISFFDKIAYYLVKIMRYSFDYLAGFKNGIIDENKYLNRIIFLETIAGVPGMVAGMIRHLQSLRTMKKDNGWINTLLDEATNERMHLLTFLELKKPSPLFRFFVIITQGIFFNSYFLLYLLSPKNCHRFVGYIEEEAVKTYSKLLEDIDNNKLPMFTNLNAPQIAIDYWKLSSEAKFKELILVIRADEANHRLVNHTLADMEGTDINPFSLKKI